MSNSVNITTTNKKKNLIKNKQNCLVQKSLTEKSLFKKRKENYTGHKFYMVAPFVGSIQEKVKFHII